MTSGTQFKQGDIVIVPFPFTNLSAVKQRPVLVLSKNTGDEDIITCGITSNLADSDNSLLIDNGSLREGALPKKSRIKVDKLFTLEKTIVKKSIASINQQTLLKVKAIFRSLV